MGNSLHGSSYSTSVCCVIEFDKLQTKPVVTGFQFHNGIHSCFTFDWHTLPVIKRNKPPSYLCWGQIYPQLYCKRIPPIRLTIAHQNWHAKLGRYQPTLLCSNWNFPKLFHVLCSIWRPFCNYCENEWRTESSVSPEHSKGMISFMFLQHAIANLRCRYFTNPTHKNICPS